MYREEVFVDQIDNGKYVKAVSKWKQMDIKTVSDLEAVLSNFSVIFAYHSGVIENPEITYHTTREIFENGKVINFTGDVRTVFEIKNQKICYDWLKDKIIEKAIITPELIKGIHKKLTDGTYDEGRYSRGERPGEYKKHDYVVGNDQGALPEEVSSEIEELCEELQDIPDKGDNIIKTAAYLHCKFENTHPFADGNGRVGRTLMNYFLMTHEHPPIVIRNETKNEYYNALGCYDKTGELDGFVAYIKKETIETWEEPRQVKKRLNEYVEKESC
jgi:Fic family protein